MQAYADVGDLAQYEHCRAKVTAAAWYRAAICERLRVTA